MAKSFLLSLLLGFGFLITSCSSSNDASSETEGNGADTIVVIDTVQQLVEVDTAKLRAEQNLAIFFEKYEVTGSFLLFDPQENIYYRHNPARNTEEFSPASTFKILNSLIALENRCDCRYECGDSLGWKGASY